MSKDKLREKEIEGLINRYMRWLRGDGGLFTMRRLLKEIIALFSDIEELEKQVRQLKESDFAEIPYASKLRKVQLDGGQFVYENILRLIRKMEGEK